MAQQKVELRKVRDFSDNLNDTFLFIKQNLKPLLTSFLGIAGIFMLLAAIFSGMYQSDVGTIFEQIFRGDNSAASTPFGVFNQTYFLVLIFSYCSVVAMQVVIIAYLKLYEENGGEAPAIDDVWKVFRSYFFPMFFYNILIYLMYALGLVLCIFPFFYVFTVLMPIPCIIMIENKSFGEAFNRCFVLIKDNFWMSLGLYILVYFIYSFSAGIITAIIGGITGALYYFTTKDISSTAGIISGILGVFSYVFYIVYYVSVVLNYYNLSERFDGTGMMRKLDAIGEGPQNFDNIQEQY